MHNNIVPFALYKVLSAPGIITGADGDLVILNGQTVDLPEGSVMQYNSIDIQAGGTLRISGNTGSWTEIGCKGNCIINGQILARAGYDGQATPLGGTFSKTSAFGLGPLSYTVAQRPGGAGGNQTTSPGSIVTAGGAAGTTGIGGGGAGANGGVGGTGGGNGGAGGPGAAGGIGGGLGNGTPGTGNSPAANPGGAGGSGGGGGARATSPIVVSQPSGGGSGYKGHHGKGLVLYVEGTISGTGAILCSGRAGFTGGNGGGSPGTGGAPGGGGGAGGSGGSLIVRYRAGVLPPSSVAGGSGGAGGLRHPQVPSALGQPGVTGTTGDNGTSNFAVI